MCATSITAPKSIPVIGKTTRVEQARAFPGGEIRYGAQPMARQYTLKSDTAGKSGLDFAARLNPQQLAAVTTVARRALVIAGAGSGKTRTLTHRVAWLLDQGLPPSRLLLLTFTNKAAREMLQRVGELVPFDPQELWGGTFHSVGNRMLRRHADLIGWRRGFSIMDREDQKDLMDAAITAAGIDTKEYRFPKADLIGDMISLARNTGISLDDVIVARYPYFAHLSEQIGEVAKAYEARKREANSMDFDDLLAESVRLLRECADVRESYQKKFAHILVDEFQDTNHIQLEFIELLAGGGAGLMVVGDDAQSIYSWRGADFENIIRFPELHPEAEVHKIETNYRSVPGILELANAAIAPNVRQFQKTLRPAREAGAAPPALVPLATPQDQARFVAQRILELRDEGVPLSEMAVLYRAHFQSMDVQMELTRRDIPFKITSGLRFFEQAHIKDASAFLRIVANPSDEIAFKRLVRMLPGIGGRTADSLWTWWRGNVAGRDWSRGLPPYFEKARVPAKAREVWKQLGYTLDELLPRDGREIRPSAALTSVIEGVYDDLLKARYPNYEARRQDLEQLRNFAAGFDSIQDLLAQLALLSGIDIGGDGRDREDEDCVTLSSVHQAKGLEWHGVFVVWLAEGMFPNNRVLQNDDDGTGLEEERRLFYVALTRAKDELHLCFPMMWPGNHTGEMMQRPSPFLAEIPAGLMEAWQVGSASGVGF